jgi:cellulose synthase operon protein C
MRRWVLALLFCQGLSCAGAPPPRSANTDAKTPVKALAKVPRNPLSDGLRALAKSDYSAARKLLLEATHTSSWRLGAALALKELDLVTGNYEAAARPEAELDADPARKVAAAMIRAKSLRARGQLDEAVNVLSQPGIASEPDARLLIGEILLEAGKTEAAQAALLTLVQDYNESRIAENDILGLARIGRAAHLLRSPEDANEAFNQAESAGTAPNQLLLWRAELYLDHHDPGHADEVVSELLARSPNDPEALVMMARVVVDQALDFDTAKGLANSALKVNPQSARARAILASVALHDMQLKEAEVELSRGLATNPRDLLLLSLRGTGLFLADDEKGFAELKERVFAFNPTYAGFFVTVAQYADWEHRYAEIVEMMREATRLDPEDARVQAELGFNLIRNGDDRSGVRALQRAFAEDPYNVRVFNTLNLYERVIPEGYVDVPGLPFAFRYPKDERTVLERTLPPMLKSAWQKMQGYYGFTPSQPVQIELYAERENFAIRTSGLPRTAIQGVCFGKTLAAMSPRHEEFNLGMTLWHELAHVFHIQLSRSRVPRWFTEGLAEYETLVERPEWRREQDQDLYQALKLGRLPHLGAMNQAFTHAEDGRDVAVAYYASSQIVRMLAEHYGRPKLKLMLELWGKSKTQDQVFAEALGKTAEELDAEVQAYLAERLKRYSGQFMPLDRVGNTEQLQRGLEATPEDPALLVRLALLQMQQGHSDLALSAVDQALKANPTHPDALRLKAQWALRQGNVILAEALVVKLLDAHHDGYQSQLLRARVMAAREQLNEVKDALGKAHQFDPDEAEPIMGLLDFSVGEQRIELLQKMAAIDEHRGETYRELADLLLKAGRNDEALVVAQSGVYADMESPAAHVQLARALGRAGKGRAADQRAADFEFESALSCPGHSQERLDAELAYAEHLRATGRATKAEEHERRAKALTPTRAAAPEAAPRAP